MKTKPYKHQADEFGLYDEEVRALFWEPGTGKTKVIIDTACQMYKDGSIDGLFVLAPNGVHRNWVSDELPIHCWDEIVPWTKTHIWYSNKSGSRATAHEMQMLVDWQGLSILVMSYPAMMTERGKDAAKSFLMNRECLYVLDESTKIKSPRAKTTKRVLASGQYATYRRILTGTPVANSPMDLYTQLKFLEPHVWEGYGCKTYSAFKTYFGNWELAITAGGQRYERCLGYRNLGLLSKIMVAFGSRVTKDEALDLPEKIYQKRYYVLSPQQRKHYDTLKTEFMLELENGKFIDAALAIVRLLRLQEIICGRTISLKENPRLALLKEVLDEDNSKAIIWCRFTKDIDAVMDLFGEEAVYIDGRVVDQARNEAVDAFQKENRYRFLVANTAAISEGLTLTAATTEVYYSNSFNLVQRLQSEDRCHRIGQHHSVRIVDLIAEGTIDEKIVESLREKRKIADQIVGDGLRQWL